MTVVLYHH